VKLAAAVHEQSHQFSAAEDALADGPRRDRIGSIGQSGPHTAFATPNARFLRDPSRIARLS